MSEAKIPEVKAPEIIEKLLQCIIGPLCATHIAPLLVEPDHIEERVLLLVRTFDLYPQYKEPFAALVKSLHTKEVGKITIEEQIRFFNTKHTRFWLLVNLMNQVLNLKELKLDLTTGRLPARAHDLIKFAYLARESFGEESRYKDLVFSAGLMFDFVFWLQRTPYLNLGQSKFDDFIGKAFTASLEQGKKIMQVSKYKSKLTHEKLTPTVAFMRQLSQVCMVVLKTSEAVDFYKKMDTLKPSDPLRVAMEYKQFGAHVGIIGSYLAQSLPVFEKLGEIMSVWGAPYLSWVKGKKEIHDAAAMAMLGVAIHERGLDSKVFGPTGKPFFELPELKYLDFTITEEVKREAKI